LVGFLYLGFDSIRKERMAEVENPMQGDNLAGGGERPADSAELDAEFDDLLQQLKVSKPKKKKGEGDKKSASASVGTESGPGLGVMDKSQYTKLLERVYVQLRANNPDLVDKKKALLRPPTVEQVGTSRILWKNFAEICKTMRRDPTHVSNFFLNELGTTGSMTSGQQFLIKGKFKPKYIESLLKKYISEYVTCNMCRGVDTKLSRDTTARMNIMTCESCGATRAVATITKGFLAATRAERRAARNAG
jgi:translation initiation factor 2 subunit 2